MLSINRSSLYYQPKPPGEREIKLKHRIDEIYTSCPFYGARRVRWQLKQEGWQISRKTVARYMRQMGLEAICPKPNLSKRALQHRIYPYLLRNLTITEPNQVWGIDITFGRLQRGWFYLVAVIDWYSRYVVDWEISSSLAVEFVMVMLNRALEKAKPQILNSDQGSQFTSEAYTALLKEAHIKISMDGKGRALDNVFTERLWRSCKIENIYIQDYETIAEARAGLAHYFEFYNYKRPHQGIAEQFPATLYFSERAATPSKQIWAASPHGGGLTLPNPNY